ncbi:Protein CBR-PQN-35 [Caenorhabditis briggsae]|uniref:Protein CBR-PQN-35 n=1 Tax=Caenorhabditis briggsae TaxID=6238 RepID=A8XHP3_CAEBR|nr:Protein CBR-PQN-35 [Caenorhabditis briggsae]CAP32160.2 Protein CBR-PQN-35 [Caenorhabditis briggsae]
MKVFALGLDENQKAEQRADEMKNDTKIPIDSVSSGVPLQTTSPAIVLAKAPRRHFTGFTCGLLSWFIGACCLVLLCLAISEVAYHRQRDQAFLRLKWAELRQRMLGYELLSQQQELDRMALEKQSPVESLPLRRSDDPIKPKIVDVIQNSESPVSDSKPSSDDKPVPLIFNNDYANEQNEKFGFLQNLMDKIRKHAQSMGLNGDMQVHVVEVKPIFGGENGEDKEHNFDENASNFQGPQGPSQDPRMIPQGPSQWPMPQFGFQQQSANWWGQQGPRQQGAMEIQTNQWNGFPQVPVNQPWYQPYEAPKESQNVQNSENMGPWSAQNDDWMIQKHERLQNSENQNQMPFQPNPSASEFQTPMDMISDDVAPKSTPIQKTSEVQTSQENVISPDQSLETIDGKFLPIRSDDTPVDSHLFQIDDP